MVVGVLGVVLGSHKVCVILPYYVHKYCMTLHSLPQIPGDWASRILSGLAGKSWIGLDGQLECGRV